MFACVCVSVSVSLASDSAQTIKVIIVKLASDMLMHHVLITLTFTFIQGDIYPNHENNKCSIISETIQAMLIKFADTCFSNLTAVYLPYLDDLDLDARS